MNWSRAMLGWSWGEEHVFASWVHWTVSYFCWKWVQHSVSAQHGMVYQGKPVLEKHAFKTQGVWWCTSLFAAVTERNIIRYHRWRYRILWAGTAASPSWPACPDLTMWEISPRTSSLEWQECFLPNTFPPYVLTEWMFSWITSAFLIKSCWTQTHDFVIGKSKYFRQFPLIFLPALTFNLQCPFLMRSFNFSLKGQYFQ